MPRQEELIGGDQDERPAKHELIGGDQDDGPAKQEVVGGDQDEGPAKHEVVGGLHELIGGFHSTGPANAVMLGGLPALLPRGHDLPARAVDEKAPPLLDPALLPLQHISVLVCEARHALHLNQRELAELIGSSERTVQRWETKRGSPHDLDVCALADAVRPHDTAIAAALDRLSSRPAGPVVPAPAPPAGSAPAPAAPARPPVPTPVLVDAIVCAAAEAMALAPQVVRPALLAAFTRARDVGLSADDVVGVLAPPANANAKSKRGEGGKRAE